VNAKQQHTFRSPTERATVVSNIELVSLPLFRGTEEVDFRQGFTISLASSIINYVASEATTSTYLLLDFASQISEKSKFQFGRWLTAEKSLNSNGKWKAHKYNFKLISRCCCCVKCQECSVYEKTLTSTFHLQILRFCYFRFSSV
jgi:hypothetical protein